MKKVLTIVLLSLVTACGGNLNQTFDDPVAFRLERELLFMAENIATDLDDNLWVEIRVRDLRDKKLWYHCSKGTALVFDQFHVQDIQHEQGSLDSVFPYMLREMGKCQYGLETETWSEFLEDYEDEEGSTAYTKVCPTDPTAFLPPTVMLEDLSAAELQCIADNPDQFVGELKSRL